jgi:hypothetical protein
MREQEQHALKARELHMTCDMLHCGIRRAEAFESTPIVASKCTEVSGVATVGMRGMTSADVGREKRFP